MNTNLEMFQSLLNTVNCVGFEGFRPTFCEQITLFNTTEYQNQCPVLYEPGIFIVLSGRKVAHINQHPLEYGSDNLLIVTSAYPMECEAFITDEGALSGFYIRLEQDMVFKTMELLKLNGFEVADDSDNYPFGFDVTSKTPRITECISRLLLVLHSKLEADALVEGILEELYFLLLTSPQGQVLVNFATKDGTYYKVTKAVNFINERFDEKISVEQLADIAGMSTSAFHRAFKQCITDSPLQYIKKVRLNRAKNILVKDGVSASEAALQVGYESISQFSREFKRYFGLPPSRALELSYRVFV